MELGHGELPAMCGRIGRGANGKSVVLAKLLLVHGSSKSYGVLWSCEIAFEVWKGISCLDKRKDPDSSRYGTAQLSDHQLQCRTSLQRFICENKKAACHVNNHNGKA